MNENLTEFSTAWLEFEERLSVVLANLTKPAIEGTLRLYAPGPAVAARCLTVEGRHTGGRGVDVRVPGERTLFYALDGGSDSMPEPAHLACELLRDECHVPHPSLLSANGEFIFGLIAELGLEILENVPDERFEHAAHHGSLDSNAMQKAVEEVLAQRFGDVETDADGDYRLNVAGTWLYLSLSEEDQRLRLWKTVVWAVNSRTAATIEANYLNRAHPTIKWVLWGHSLIQEMYMPVEKFMLSSLMDGIDEFTNQYSQSRSSLELRLGGGRSA